MDILTGSNERKYAWNFYKHQFCNEKLANNRDIIENEIEAMRSRHKIENIEW